MPNQLSHGTPLVRAVAHVAFVASLLRVVCKHQDSRMWPGAHREGRLEDLALDHRKRKGRRRRHDTHGQRHRHVLGARTQVYLPEGRRLRRKAVLAPPLRHRMRCAATDSSPSEMHWNCTHAETNRAPVPLLSQEKTATFPYFKTYTRSAEQMPWSR